MQRYIETGGMLLDRYRRTVLVGGQDRAVNLSGVEFRLLEALMLNRDRVLSREEILAAAWGKVNVGIQAIDVYVSYLRAKLGARAIATVRGSGYRLGPASKKDSFSALLSAHSL